MNRRWMILGGTGLSLAAGLGIWTWFSRSKTNDGKLPTPEPTPAQPTPEPAKALPKSEVAKTGPAKSSIREGLIKDPTVRESPEAAIARGTGLAWRKPQLAEVVTPDKWLAVRPLSEPGFAARAGAGVDITDAVLRELVGDKELAPGPVVFAIRGAVSDRPSNPFASGHRLSIVPPDHLNFCCTIGVWDPETKQLSTYAASTVPNRTAIVSSALGVQAANMLLPGVFDYVPGSHSNYKKYGFPFSIIGALRQNGAGGGAGALKVLRATTPMGMQGASVSTTTDDNIHCAETPLLEPYDRFSSEGCMVVAGRYTPQEGHTGPWARFLKDAKFKGRSKVTVILANSTQLPVV
ncbi:MAG: hypothetical protein ACK5XZ_03070 [Hyphomonadaceae bacterium]|jgi:hypothetical protein|uniref:hypothetical protein n=1 Tax=Aquidulcibacter sp. TaxID=2052990 RepID=UPI0022C8F605|nr:hypothetical protein [Aquidulcibacter sp.]MCE2892125.1 hypothetical protein [Hyphomonadaceae bacterium]MCZ8206576.1 hypothetical protein [Aquidulcibacter sp.]